MLPAEILPRVMTALTALSEGRTLTAACAKAGITASTLRRYCEQMPLLQEQFNDAEQRGYDTMADLLLEPFDNPIYGMLDTKAAKLMSDNIKWYLSRKRPSQYGDRTIVDVNLSIDQRIVEALAKGRERAESAVLEDVPYTVTETKPLERIEHVVIPDELKEFI